MLFDNITPGASNEIKIRPLTFICYSQSPRNCGHNNRIYDLCKKNNICTKNYICPKSNRTLDTGNMGSGKVGVYYHKVNIIWFFGAKHGMRGGASDGNHEWRDRCQQRHLLYYQSGQIYSGPHRNFYADALVRADRQPMVQPFVTAEKLVEFFLNIPGCIRDGKPGIS